MYIVCIHVKCSSPGERTTITLGTPGLHNKIPA